MEIEAEVYIEREVDRDLEKKKAKPYKAALKQKWKAFREFYERNPQDLLSPLTINGGTAFHLAVSSGDESLLPALLRFVPPCKQHEALMRTDSYGNTALHEVAIKNSVASAIHLVDSLLKCGGISEEENGVVGDLSMRTKLGETPLYRAVALGKTKMAKYFASVIEERGDIKKHYRRNDNISILHIAVIGQHFDTAVWILGKDKELGEKEGENGMKCLHLLALMPSAFKSTNSMGRLKTFIYSRIPTEILDDDNDNESQASSSQPEEDLETGKKNSVSQQSEKSTTKAFSRAAWKALIQRWPIIKDIVKEKHQHESAVILLKLLVEQDTSWKKVDNEEETTTIWLGRGPGKGDKQKSTTPATEEEEKAPVYGVSSSETPLLLAAKTGNIEVFKEILNQYPQAVEYTDENKQNVLHLAILHRRWEIFKHIEEQVTGITMKKLAARIDKDGFTVLHQTADITNYKRGTRPGPAFQLQEELEWFHSVKDLIPSHYAIHRDKKYYRTAKKLFEIRHRKQLIEAQTWIKDTSGSCSTVSVLVATVVFAAAYTVPGGTNTQGLPVFLHSSLFTLFTVMDVVSLVISLTSVVMFLSILTSPREQSDFLISLPRKLTLGFTFLFFSVITTMITFTASILLLIRLEKRWTTTLIYMAAFIPVAMFGLMQFPLYTSFLRSLNTIFQTTKEFLPGKKKKN